MTGFVGLFVWWASGGPRPVIAALGAILAFIVLGQDLRLLAEPGGEARVAWTLAGAPLLVLRRARLAGVCEVLIERREESTDSGTTTMYAVSLATAPALRLWTVGTPARARSLAMRVARTLGLGVRDASDGYPRLRAREEVALNLGQLLRRRGVEPGPLVVPAGSPIRLVPGSASELRLPARPWPTRPFLGCLGILAVPGVWMGVRALPTQAGAIVVIVCAWVGFVAARALIMMHRDAFIRVDGNGLVTGLVGLHRRRTRLEDLQEVCATGVDLVLLTARRRVVVPYVFRPDELALALAFVERAALAHRSSRRPPSSGNPT
jgi:hypothetical protein